MEVLERLLYKIDAAPLDMKGVVWIDFAHGSSRTPCAQDTVPQQTKPVTLTNCNAACICICISYYQSRSGNSSSALSRRIEIDRSPATTTRGGTVSRSFHRPRGSSRTTRTSCWPHYSCEEKKSPSPYWDTGTLDLPLHCQLPLRSPAFKCASLSPPVPSSTYGRGMHVAGRGLGCRRETAAIATPTPRQLLWPGRIDRQQPNEPNDRGLRARGPPLVFILGLAVAWRGRQHLSFFF
jgi:hypothetical protein